MTLLRHLLRYGGLYIAAASLWGCMCAAAYAGSHHYGWPGVIGLHLGVALVVWMAYGVYHSAQP